MVRPDRNVVRRAWLALGLAGAIAAAPVPGCARDESAEAPARKGVAASNSASASTLSPDQQAVLDAMQRLSWLVGDWEGEGATAGATDLTLRPQKGSWSGSYVWGGRRLRLRFEAQVEGAGPYAYTAFITWNPSDQRYQTIWISEGSYIHFTETGDLSADGNTLTLVGVKKFNEAMAPVTDRSVFTRSGDDGWSVVDHRRDEQTGQWNESFRFTLRRRHAG